MTDTATHRLQTQEIRRTLRHGRRQHRAVHGRAAPATICTIAATTFSMSPTSRRVRRNRAPARARQVAQRRRTRGLQDQTEGAARRTGRREGDPRATAAVGSPDGRDAHGRFRARLPEPGEGRSQHAGARDIADKLMASLGSMLLYWYPLQPQRQAHRCRERRRFDRRPLPAPAARQDVRSKLVGARRCTPR